MEFLKNISPDEIIGEWLRSEYRTRSDIREQVDKALKEMQIDDSLLFLSDYHDMAHNKARRDIMYRTSRHEVASEAHSFTWGLFVLEWKDVVRLRTLTGPCWYKITKGEYSIQSMVELLQTDEGREYLRSSGCPQNFEDEEEIERSIMSEGIRGKPTIIVQGETMRLVDGYHRLVALFRLRSRGIIIQMPQFYIGKSRS